MTNSLTWHVIPKASIRPEKIVFYKHIIKVNTDNSKLSKRLFSLKKDNGTTSEQARNQITSTTKHGVNLSVKAVARIQEKIKWLYALSKPRDIVLHSGKQIFKHRLSFITLTLPCSQAHSSAEIVKTCLNQYLTECRDRFSMHNYVWRLEYQKNGNLHIHLVTDAFLEYWQSRSIWNRCVQKLGYVDKYRQARETLSLSEYINKYGNNGKDNFNTLNSRYTYGLASKWSSPNTSDVRCVVSVKNIGRYLSKYLSKSTHCVDDAATVGDNDNFNNSRLWFCSRSLSRVSAIEEFVENCSFKFKKMMNTLTNVTKVVYEYCEVFYFNVLDQGNEFMHYYTSYLNDYAIERQYVNKLLT